MTAGKWSGVPDCSDPDEKLYPPNINALLTDIKRYRRQLIDPDGYRREMAEASERARQKKVKGSKEGGKKE